MWRYRGHDRPPFAVPPGPGQESVWDYPRPPVVVEDARRVTVGAGEALLADTRAARRVLETAGPPTFYLPGADVRTERLVPMAQTSWCEWKGEASYYALRDDDPALAIAWAYRVPSEPYASLVGCFGFYPGRIACHVDGERVRPQPGGFYGGWVTGEIVGPFKGEPGTGHW